ncbi:hypothetical protein [Gluconacetobacter diazotrophicus]|nr:hypothetical protein [Gluconacetobacter diazotrophicus]
MAAPAFAASERTVERAGSWSDVIADEATVWVVSTQSGIKVRVAPMPDGSSLAMEVIADPSVESQDASFSAGEFSLPLQRISTSQQSVLFGTSIPAQSLPSFIHAFTHERTATIRLGEVTDEISLDGTSAAVSGLSFYAQEHRIALPAPFATGDAPVVPDAATEQAAVSPADPGVPTAPAPPPSTPPAITSSCRDNWKACHDNEDLMNNYHGVAEARAKCQEEGDRRAAFGTPKWPGFWSGGSFGHFDAGSDGPRTGRLTIVEPDAQFQNQFGAMAHSTVLCLYDFDQKTVQSIQISPN